MSSLGFRVLSALLAAAVFTTPTLATKPAPKIWKAITPAHIRSAPSGRSPIVAVVPRDATLTMVNPCTAVWCAIEYNGKRGWVHRLYIGEMRAKPARAPNPAPEPAIIASLKLPPPVTPPASGVSAEERVQGSYRLIGLDAAGSLPVREGPLDTARLVATLPSTASGIADLNTCVREWCLIEQGGIKGYVLSRFLTRMAGASDQRYSIDGEESVKVVSYASADAGVVGEIPFYASGIVPIGECNAQWCHVRYLGLVGWVDTRSLRLESGPSG